MRRDPTTGVETIHARFQTYAYDMHAHDDEWLVGATHHGVQDFYCRGRRRQSRTSQIILIEPSERHDGRSASPEGYSYSMLYIPRHWLRDEISGDGAIGFRETLVEDRALIEAISATTQAILGNAPCLLIEHLRDGLIDRLRWHLGAKERSLERRDANVALRALDYLQSNYASNVSSADLVQASGATSRFQLTRSFNASYGTAPHARLVEIRLAKARALLRQGVSPAKVAANCGFADQSHMTRWFQRAYGISPGAYGRGRTNVQDMTGGSVYWAQSKGQMGPSCTTPKSPSSWILPSRPGKSST